MHFEGNCGLKTELKYLFNREDCLEREAGEDNASHLQSLNKLMGNQQIKLVIYLLLKNSR